MSSSPAESTPEWWPTPGVARATNDVPEQVRQLTEAFTNGADLRALGSQIVGLRELIDQLESVWTNATAEFDAQNGPADDGAGSLAAWLRHQCRLAPAEAAARARVAKAVSGPLSATGQAMAEGQISWRHADVICRTLNDVPVERREQAERVLLEPAKTLDPMILRRLGQAVLHRLDVDRAEQAAVRRLDRRGISLAETFDGMVAISGLLDPVAGATVMTAVNSMVTPPRVSDFLDGESADNRSWPQRRADALTDICRAFLDSGAAPIGGGERPHLSVIVDHSVLRKDPGCGTGEIDGVGPLTAEQVRMLGCDGIVSRIVMNGPSQVLDVGRATRTIPTPLRRAVSARDRHCVADGCARSPQHCDVHHIQFWENGGATALENLVLLCRRHHGFVHERGWQVCSSPNGGLRLVPPQGRPPPD